MLLFFYICLFFFIILSVLIIFQISFYIKRGQDIQNRKNLFIRYDMIKKLLDESKEIAYNKVYREEILVHHMSNYKINDSMTNEYGQTYVKLVLNCCGESVTKDLVDIFGSIDSLCIFLMTGFVNKTIEFESQILAKSTNEDSEPEDIQDFLLGKKT